VHSEVQELAENCLGVPQLPTAQWQSHILFMLAKKEE
jgi:hypothetical protein